MFPLRLRRPKCVWTCLFVVLAAPVWAESADVRLQFDTPILANTGDSFTLPVSLARDLRTDEAPAMLAFDVVYQEALLEPKLSSEGDVGSPLLATWYGKQAIATLVEPGRIRVRITGAPAFAITTFDNQRPAGNPSIRKGPFPLLELRFIPIVRHWQDPLPFAFSDVSMAGTNGEALRGFGARPGYVGLGPDTDRDGIPNQWEALLGLDENDGRDATQDVDEDGFTAYHEYVSNTDPHDSASAPVSQYFVSPDGSDRTGDGSSWAPWRTLNHALAFAARSAHWFNPVTVVAGAGRYTGSIALPAYVTVAGVSAETTLLVGNGLGPVVHASVKSGIEHFTIATNPDAPAGATLVDVVDAEFEIDTCVLNGNHVSESIGVAFHGNGSSRSTVRDSEIRNVAHGLVAYGSGVTVARTDFESIARIAVNAYPESEGDFPIAPMLGDAANILETGLNRFRNVGERLALNTSTAPSPAQLNDWGAYTEEITSAAMAEAGLVTYKPYVEKALLPESLVVFVCDGLTQKPLGATAGATVKVNPSGHEETPDGETGLLIITPIEVGQASVSVEAEGYLGAKQTVSIEPGGVHPVQFDMYNGDSNLDATPEGAGPSCYSSGGGAGGGRPWADAMVAMAATLLLARARRRTVPLHVSTNV